MVQLSAIRCSCIAILRVSLVSFATITLCVAPQQVFIVVVYFVIDLVRERLNTPSYVHMAWYLVKHRDNSTFTLPYLYREQALMGRREGQTNEAKRHRTDRGTLQCWNKTVFQ
jgi:hypothetical protein